MTVEKVIISQCIDLANQVMKNGMNATILIKIGDNFKFEFDNKENKMNDMMKKKSPSQEARDIERSKKYKENLAKNKHEQIEKVKEEPKDERIKEETEDDKIKVETKDEKVKEETENEKQIDEDEEIEFTLENSCEKVFVIPKYDKEKNNNDIKHDINRKFEEMGITIRKIFIQREGHPELGKYNRSIVLTEQFLKKELKRKDFRIENCWVLMD